MLSFGLNKLNSMKALRYSYSCIQAIDGFQERHVLSFKQGGANYKETNYLNLKMINTFLEAAIILYALLLYILQFLIRQVLVK